MLANLWAVLKTKCWVSLVQNNQLKKMDSKNENRNADCCSSSLMSTFPFADISPTSKQVDRWVVVSPDIYSFVFLFYSSNEAQNRLVFKKIWKKLQNHVIFYPNNPLVYVFNTLWDPFPAMLVSHWHQRKGKNTVFFGQLVFMSQPSLSFYIK